MMVKGHNFPIRVFIRGVVSEAQSRPRLWSRHKSAAEAERSYSRLRSDKPDLDIELVDIRTGERKRHGSASWRMGHNWDEAFVLRDLPCAMPCTCPDAIPGVTDEPCPAHGGKTVPR